jgi:hypothetical protein
MTVKDLRPGMYFSASYPFSFSHLIVAIFPWEHGDNVVNITNLYNDGRITTVPDYVDTPVNSDEWTTFE